jgi:hypothetical protein
MSKINIEKAVDELRTHFDNGYIESIAKGVSYLTPYEFSKIRQLIKTSKNDEIHNVSDRISLQLVFGEVFIINRNYAGGS